MVGTRAARTPSQRYAEGLRATEIGSTSGEDHEAIIRRTVGRDRALLIANDLQSDEPVVIGDDDKHHKP